MNKYIIASTKPWNKNLASDLQKKLGGEWQLIDDKEKFTIQFLNSFNPEKIFIPHWSHLIPEEIYSTFECIVFHLTDLPYGRGGSPLQNLIKAGHQETKISAIRVEKQLDAGDVYLKRSLSLFGTAEEIFIRTNEIIEEMIIHIIKENPQPTPQKGEVVQFRRRTPEQSTIEGIADLKTLFDHIRMLDAEGYPEAFLETDNFRFEFKRASLKTDSIIADVRIFEK